MERPRARRRLLRGFEGGSDGLYHGAGHGPCTDQASLGPGEDLGAVGELEELQDVRVQSDDRVVIIGGFGNFFLSRIAVE